jgi:hypothetical protein
MDRRVLFAVGIFVLCAAGYFLTKEDPMAVPPGALSTDSAIAAEIDWTADYETNPITAPLFKLTETVGVDVALDSLQVMAKRDTGVSGHGHQIAHSLGRFAFRVKPDIGLLSVCRPTFSAGCYHGVVEGHLQSLPTVDAKALTTTCADLASGGNAVITARECAHGLGHGLLERLEYSLNDALKGCGSFATDVLKVECYDGVFMENLVHGAGLPGEGNEHQHGAMNTSKALAFRVEDLGFPCDSVATGYQPSCWNYQPTAVARMTNDRDVALTTCRAAATNEGRERCYRGFGKQSTVWQGHNELRMLDVCSQAPKPYNEDCVAGLVEASIDQAWGPETALPLCARMATLGGDPTVCYETIGERVVLLYPNPTEAELVCASIKETAHAEACKRGMGRG